MTKACFWMLSLASAVALAIAPVTGPVMAQARVDSPATTAGSPQQQTVAPQQIAAPAPSPDTSPQRAGSLQGFGPMQINSLLGVQPMQNGGGKW